MQVHQYENGSRHFNPMGLIVSVIRNTSTTTIFTIIFRDFTCVFFFLSSKPPRGASGTGRWSLCPPYFAPSYFCRWLVVWAQGPTLFRRAVLWIHSDTIRSHNLSPDARYHRQTIPGFLKVSLKSDIVCLWCRIEPMAHTSFTVRMNDCWGYNYIPSVHIKIQFFFQFPQSQRNNEGQAVR